MCAERSSSWVHLGSMKGLSTTAHVSSKVKGISPYWLRDQATNVLFVCLLDMHWSNNKTEAHAISQTTITVQECYSHQSVWYVAQTCSQQHLSILLIQLEQKGILATCWNKQRKPKGKSSRRGLGMVLLLPPALALWAAAVLLCLADASFCPAGQKELCRGAMDSWWKRHAKFHKVICCSWVHKRTGSFCEQE